ncbi:hypothetical protein [Clostridium perfringens]|uniref:hypothetical protein n=1 Tax=Clostridium perfringens TaxID=1502 RepID=UPI001ABB6932|nr:hypothetical protein [Clostridium perfringens]MBO3342096.1 hypothetical protein [Clostridium perfringens]
MTKEEIKKIEYKLRDYYQKDIKIEGIEREINLLKEHIKNIDNRIKNMDIDITEGATNNTGYLTQNWGEKVQTSSDGTSHMEREIIRIIDNLEWEKMNKKLKIERLELFKQKIKEENISIENNINRLEPHQRELLKYKYGDRLSGVNIAMKLNISTATLSREKKKILTRFEPLLN